jgi:hypothetical protein
VPIGLSPEQTLVFLPSFPSVYDFSVLWKARLRRLIGGAWAIISSSFFFGLSLLHMFDFVLVMGAALGVGLLAALAVPVEAESSALLDEPLDELVERPRARRIRSRKTIVGG